MDIGSIAASAAITAGDGLAKPKTAPEAAQQFEAMLLAQMLQAARPQDGEEDTTNSTMWDMAAQQFSQLLAKSGGLGLSKMISASLDRK